MGKSQPGNKAAYKLPKLQKLGLEQKAYESYCHHLESGAIKETWYFEHPKISLTWETMEKYVEENPSVFPPIKSKVAYAKGYRRWEKLVEEHAQGKNECVTPALQMTMRNKFGWDREEKAAIQAPVQLDGQLKILKSVDGEWKEVKN